MSYRKLLLAGATLAASTMAAVAPAHASIIDRPHFKVLGVVIVWAADESDGSTPVATDFVIDDTTGSGDTDLIGNTATDGRTVLTGTLTATADSASTAGLGSVLDIDDGGPIATVDLDSPSSFSSFDVTGASITGDALTYESSFYVASNTAFAIDGVATETTQSGDFELTDIGYSMDVTVTGTDGPLTFGGNAQNPGGSFTSFADLSEVDGSSPVFVGAQRTAASAGTIVGQSVRFDATYTLGAGGAYDLSQGAGEIQADVVYTVYVP